MKTKKNVKSLSQREINRRIRQSVQAMAAKFDSRSRSLILLAVVLRKIKGKLGFDFQTADLSFLEKSQLIEQALTLDAGSYFTVPFAGLDTLTTQNTAFKTAIDNVGLGVIGAEGAKTSAKSSLKDTLDLALAYVNALAKADQANAVGIITSAKMEVASFGAINKQDFSVRQGKATGEVILRALAAKIDAKYVNATYEWQYSLTSEASAVWVNLPLTLMANTVVAGLEPGKIIWFRKRYTTVKGGTTAWCVALSITPV
jgi:hypothetical protein